jgi:hypothetical protein
VRRTLLLLAVCLAVLYTRRPDAFRNPQFWAEDGGLWFADAYQAGPWRPLFVPYSGYLHLLERLGGALALLVPLRWAPAVTNAIALGVQVLPVLLLFSRRFSRVVPSLVGRASLAAIYLALPSSWEVHANLTNAQWHLGLALAMLLAAPAAETPAERVAELGVAALASLSGPFSLLCLPGIAIRLLLRRERGFLPLALVTTAGAGVQAAVLLAHRVSRVTAPLAASVRGLVRIVGGQLVIASLAGQRWLTQLLERRIAVPLLVLAFCVFVGTAAVAGLRGPLELRLLWIYAMGILISGLVLPVGNGSSPAWPFLAHPGSNGRYWFTPMVVFLASVVWMTGRAQPRAVRFPAIALLCVLPVGAVKDWRWEYPDRGWPAAARRFEDAPPGTRMEMPIVPAWFELTLVKK